MNIRKAINEDLGSIWPIFKKVIEKEDTYVFEPDSDMSVCKDYWFSDGINSYVAEDEDEVVGMYRILANQIGLGSHVANASFMVSPDHQGKGIGKAMGMHSLKEAKKLGFKAMQFNFVVSTNTAAIKLWEKLGFDIVGTLPKAFNHGKHGFVDAYIMYRFLDDIKLY